MSENRGSPARLELIRRIAQKRQQSGAHERTLERLRAKGLDFIVNPRMPKSATLREPRETDMVSDLDGGKAVREKEEVSTVLGEFGLNNGRVFTTGSQKLQALWDARKGLGIKSGEEADLGKLVVYAATALQIRCATLQTFVNYSMTSAQRLALKNGLQGGAALPAPSDPEPEPEPKPEADQPLESEVEVLAGTTTSAHKGRRGPPPKVSYHDRLMALAVASVKLRGGDSGKKIKMSVLAERAAPQMGLAASSVRLFILGLDKEQRKVLGLKTRKPKVSRA